MMTAAERQEVCLGAAETIPPGEGKSFTHGNEEIAVFRMRDGSLFATQARCPHSYGPLADGITGSCSVICPLHSWRFDLRTGLCLNDPSHSLRTYPVREMEGQVVITIP